MGWEPLTPIDMPGGGHSTKDGSNQTNGKRKDDESVSNMQTAICFRRKNNNSSQEHLASHSGNSPNLSYDDFTSIQYPNTMGVERHDCLCLETVGENYLGFHDVPNALLLDLVQCVMSDWNPGLKGISEAVYSVISDYSVAGAELPVIPGSVRDERKYLQLKGSPWSHSEEGADLEDAISAENLTLSLIACLARAQYKLQISINMDTKTRVFFFIKDKENREVRLPTFTGVGLGNKNSLYIHETYITRTKTSFFRARYDLKLLPTNILCLKFKWIFEFRNKNKGKSIRKRIQASFRRKSARDKQKKMDQNRQFQCEMAPNSSGGAAGDMSDNGTNKLALQPIDDNLLEKAMTPKRKTSNYLTVEDGIQHLSISEISDEETS